MIRVALLSRWHVHANNYADDAKENKDVEIVKIWDEDPLRGAEWAKSLGVGFEANIQAILENPDIDAVVVTTPTSMHKDIIIEAAKHGKHIFTEKILAFTVADCEAIYAEVEKAQVELMVSLPRLMEPPYLFIQQALETHLLGEVNYARCRVAHDGLLPNVKNPNGWLPRHFLDTQLSGGGAFVDFAAHPIYLLNRIGGKIKNVHPSLTQFLKRGADDNSSVAVEYEKGMLGIMEASFVNRGYPFTLEVAGTEGTIRVEDEEVRYRTINSNIWQNAQLPSPAPKAFKQWTDAILYHRQPLITKTDIIDLTRVNELARQNQ